MKKRTWAALLLMIVTLLTAGSCMSVSAYTGWKKVNKTGDMQYYGKKGKLTRNKWVGSKHLNANGFMDRNKWIKDGKKRYYVNNAGNKVKGVVKIGKYYYYFDANGVNKTGWKTYKGSKYYFLSTTRAAITNKVYKFKNKKTYAFGKNGHMLTGWQKINGSYYYFKDDLKKGWLTLKGKRYYLIKAQNGKRAEGIFSVSGKLYYFDPDTGVMAKNTTVAYKDREYIVAANGVCTIVPEENAPTDEMLFFLSFESGSEAYNQTGGDGGKACGAYQFDYRYALLPFVKYAYSTNPVVCAPFKKYAAWKLNDTNKAKLKGNKTFYAAWHKIYKENPHTFSRLQDAYAKLNYYDNVERILENAGISIATRSDLVKGAIYSYSIQHGPGSLGMKGNQCGAIGAVQSLGTSGKINALTDQAFLKKLYLKRIKDFPAYKTRYVAEYKLAVKLLLNL